MTRFAPEYISVSVIGPKQLSGGPTDLAWVVLARYKQPDSDKERDLFTIIYHEEQEAHRFAKSLQDTFVSALLFDVP